MLKRTWLFLKELVREWNKDQVMLHSAAVAYYAIFSLPPFLVVLVTVAGFFSQHFEDDLFRQLAIVTSVHTADTLRETLTNAQQGSSGIWAHIVGGIALVFGSTGIYRSLYFALNQILGTPPRRYRSKFQQFRIYSISFLLLMSTAFLLPLLVASSSFVDIFAARIAQYALIPQGTIAATNFLFSGVVVAALLASLYAVIPSRRIAAGPILIGSIATTILFLIGKIALTAYITSAHVGSTYGVAASLLVLLLWIYYCTHMFLFGGEIIDILHKHERRKALNAG